MISSASHAFLAWYFTNILASQSSASLVPRKLAPSKEVASQSSLVATSNPITVNNTNLNVTTGTSFAPEPTSGWIQTGLPTSGQIAPPQTQPITMNGFTTVTPPPPEGNAGAPNGKLEISQIQSVQNGGTPLIPEKNAAVTTGQSSISQTQTVNKPTVQGNNSTPETESSISQSHSVTFGGTPGTINASASEQISIFQTQSVTTGGASGMSALHEANEVPVQAQNATLQNPSVTGGNTSVIPVITGSNRAPTNVSISSSESQIVGSDKTLPAPVPLVTSGESPSATVNGASKSASNQTGHHVAYSESNGTVTQLTNHQESGTGDKNLNKEEPINGTVTREKDGGIHDNMTETNNVPTNGNFTEDQKTNETSSASKKQFIHHSLSTLAIISFGSWFL